MTKIEIDSDIEMLTNKQLKINVLKFLDNYKNILIDKIKDPKIYNDPYIKMDINVFSVDDLTDDDLKRLMDKYHEKQTRYELKMNEATERNQKIINLIYQEQARRLINKNVQMFRESRMDTTLY
jgi:hypothetical protein